VHRYHGTLSKGWLNTAKAIPITISMYSQIKKEMALNHYGIPTYSVPGKFVAWHSKNPN